jgi:hypothetical protein
MDNNLARTSVEVVVAEIKIDKLFWHLRVETMEKQEKAQGVYPESEPRTFRIRSISVSHLAATFCCLVMSKLHEYILLKGK